MNYIDIHSHVLPCIDDGAADVETALEMLRMAQAEGISDIIVTPHYTSGRFRADSRRIKEQLDKLREKVSEAGLPINLYPGTEVYYRGGLEEKFESGELLGNKRFQSLMEKVREEYDMVIIDTPPLGSVIDAAVVSKHCDGVLLVIASGAVSYRFARRIKEQLQMTGCPILGCVLNKVKLNDKGYYGKYYSEYYQNYE